MNDFTWRQVIRDGLAFLFVAGLFIAWCAK